MASEKIPSVSVSFKKRPGVLALHDSLIWREGSERPDIQITYDSIKNLQQTPTNSPNVKLKVIFEDSNNEIRSVIFTFTDEQNARADCSIITEVLQAKIAQTRSKQKSAGEHETLNLGQDELLANIELQKSLLRNNRNLAEIFRNLVIKGSISNEQFWYGRSHLLRNYAIETSQKRGSQNVLAAIRPEFVENKIRVALTREQIQDLLRQHPLVRRIYSECTPPMKEGEFWGRFFMSKLCRRLKGESISQNDATDNVLDRYIDEPDEDAAENSFSDKIFPSLNIAANDANVSQNPLSRADVGMNLKQSGNLLKSLNLVSRRMLNLSKNTLVSENNKTERFSHLRDLNSETEVKRILLNLSEQRLLSGENQSDKSEPIDVPNLYRILGQTLGKHSSNLRINTDEIFVSLAKLFMPDNEREDVFDKIPQLKEELSMCHSTGQEFLKQFWSNLQLHKFADDSKLVASIKVVSKIKSRTDALKNQFGNSKRCQRCIDEMMHSLLQSCDKALEAYERISLGVH